MDCDFTIKNPLWARILSWCVAAVGLIAIAAVTAVYFTVTMPYPAFVALEAVGAFFAAFGILCVYVGVMEKFELRGGVFRYRKPFKRSQSARIEDIAEVVQRNLPRGLSVMSVSDVVFYGKNGEKLIHFLDDGTAFRNGKFVAALSALEIPYCVTNKNNGRTV